MMLGVRGNTLLTAWVLVASSYSMPMALYRSGLEARSETILRMVSALLGV